MIWEEWIQTIADAMGLSSTTIAANLVSCIFLLSIIVIVLIASEGNVTAMVLAGFFSCIFFVVLQWLPLWSLIIYAFLSILIFAGKIRDVFGG